MSIKSTHYCTKEFASKVIMQLVQTDNLSEEQLANMLEEAIHNGFYNFRIVSDDEFKKYKDNNLPVLDDINNLPEYNDVY